MTIPRSARLGLAHEECARTMKMPSTRVQAPRMKRNQCVYCGDPMIPPHPATESVTVADLHDGDVVTCLPGITAGRVRIEEISEVRRDGRRTVRYQYRSRNCRQGCYDTPYNCWHYGEAGGGTAGLFPDVIVERFVAM